jgi:hypothetical protein
MVLLLGSHCWCLLLWCHRPQSEATVLYKDHVEKMSKLTPASAQYQDRLPPHQK